MPDSDASQRSYRPFLWLGLAFLLSLVAAGRWAVPLAAWLAPAFLLRFVRQQPPVRGFLLGAAASAIAGGIAWRGMIPGPDAVFYAVIATGSLTGMLPYLADRLAAARLGGAAATLVLPTAATALEYLGSLGTYGTWGAMAYTQPNLTLLQLASVTGLWGITFLIYWTAPVVNAAWDARFDGPRLRRSFVPYAGTLAAVLLFGSLRLALMPVADTVPVATVTGPRHAGNFFSSVDLDDGPGLHEATRAIQRDYLTHARRAARVGARLVTWPEAAVPVRAPDEESFLEAARTLACEAQIDLAMALIVLPADFPASPGENKLVWIGPGGTVRAEYLKAHPVPGEPVVPGDGRPLAVETSYGTWSGAICFDMDHPRLIRQAGQRGADAIVAPSNDWAAIADVHAHMARVRAVENGVALVRPTSGGRTLVADPLGRTLARMDHRAHGEHVLVARVPVEGTTTLYALVGDAFAWGCLAAFAGLAGIAVLRAYRLRRVERTTRQPA